MKNTEDIWYICELDNEFDNDRNAFPTIEEALRDIYRNDEFDGFETELLYVYKCKRSELHWNNYFEDIIESILDNNDEQPQEISDGLVSDEAMISLQQRVKAHYFSGGMDNLLI